MRRISPFALVAIFTSSPARAEESTVRAPAVLAAIKPPRELTALKMFNGTWQCEGKSEASVLGPAHDTHTQIVFRAVLDGAWYEVKIEERKSKENPAPLKFESLWGYDEARQKIVRFDLANTGGHGDATAAEWVGDQLLFAGTFMGTRIEHAFQRKSDSEFVDTYRFIDAAGRSIPASEETCRRHRSDTQSQPQSQSQTPSPTPPASQTKQP